MKEVKKYLKHKYIARNSNLFITTQILTLLYGYILGFMELQYYDKSFSVFMIIIIPLLSQAPYFGIKKVRYSEKLLPMKNKNRILGRILDLVFGILLNLMVLALGMLLAYWTQKIIGK